MSIATASNVVPGSIVADANDCQRLLKNLISASHRSYIDLNSYLPWERGIDKSKPPKRADRSWLFGTPYWPTFTAEQQSELLWLETARDVSLFIHLEHIVPQLYGGYCNELKSDLDPFVYEYLMLFSREELTHIMAFQRYRSIAKIAFFPPPGSWIPLTRSLLTMRPEIGILFALVIEWVAELGAMYSTQSPEVEPLTKGLFREHHIEELRHLAFGKAISEGFFKRASRAEAEAARQLMKVFVPKLLAQYTYNPDISAFTSFPFPIAADDQEAIDGVVFSEYNREMNRIRFGQFYDWCESLDLM